MEGQQSGPRKGGEHDRTGKCCCWREAITMRIAITGGAGFIGSNFVHYWLREHTDDTVVVIDKLTYAGNMKNLSGVMSDARFHFFPIDVATPKIADAIAGSDIV